MSASNDIRYKRNAINFFHENGIQLCDKCLLRLCAHKDCDYYKKFNYHNSGNTSIKSINISLAREILGDKLDTSDENDLVIRIKGVLSDVNCVSCIGLLADSYCRKVGTQLSDYLLSANTCGHTFESFQLQMSLPVSITLRNELLVAKLKHFLNGMACDHSIDFALLFTVKDILRLTLSSHLSSLLSKPFDINAKFVVSINFTHDESDTECDRLFQLCPKTFFPKKCRKSMTESFVNRTSIVRALEMLDNQTLIDWTLNRVTDECKLATILPNNHSIFIAGRYLKFSRNLPQSPWILNGERLMESSVQDIIITEIKKLISYSDTKFSAAGREDVDVCMLGRGRPFIVEVINPKTMDLSGEQLSHLQSLINVSKEIGVRDLQLVNKDDVQTHIKEGESEKTKTYCALCCISRPFNDNDCEKLAKLEDLVIYQKTPIRVLHRRTLSVRQRHIYKLWSQRVTDTSEIPIKYASNIDSIFKLFMTTEAGTYIKEFVHSDFGRTEPSLATILGGCEADILQLDVMEINMDWPPFID